ncbi:MAG: FAD/NAD(P)-binding protein, partial [Planctomycetaceae bacterium]
PTTVRVMGVRTELPDVRTLELAFLDDRLAAGYRFAPGQFNMLYLPGVGEAAISISADPASRPSWSHTIRGVGNVTRGLVALQVGETLGLRGPFGTGWPLTAAHGRDLVLVAGGLGLAPLRPVIEAIRSQRNDFGQISLLVGARDPAALLFQSAYADWRRDGINVQVSVDRPSADWRGEVGLVTRLLDRLTLPDPRATWLFACGPEVMMDFTCRSALARGLAAEQLWLSAERNMQCAIALCGHCQWGTEFVCREGPVFPYSRVAPFLRVEGL